MAKSFKSSTKMSRIPTKVVISGVGGVQQQSESSETNPIDEVTTQDELNRAEHGRNDELYDGKGNLLNVNESESGSEISYGLRYDFEPTEEELESYENSLNHPDDNQPDDSTNVVDSLLVEQFICKQKADALLDGVDTFVPTSLGDPPERPYMGYRMVVQKALDLLGTMEPSIFDKDTRRVLKSIPELEQFDEGDVVGPVLCVLAHEVNACLHAAIDEGNIHHERVTEVDGVKTNSFVFANGQTLTLEQSDRSKETLRVFNLLDFLVYYHKFLPDPILNPVEFVAVDNILSRTPEDFHRICIISIGRVNLGKRDRKTPKRLADSVDMVPKKLRVERPKGMSFETRSGPKSNDRISGSSVYADDGTGNSPERVEIQSYNVEDRSTSSMKGDVGRGKISIRDDPALITKSKRPINVLPVSKIPPPLTQEEILKADTKVPVRSKVKKPLKRTLTSSTNDPDETERLRKVVEKLQKDLEVSKEHSSSLRNKLSNVELTVTQLKEKVTLNEQQKGIEKIRKSGGPTDAEMIWDDSFDEGPQHEDSADEIAGTIDPVVCAGDQSNNDSVDNLKNSESDDSYTINNAVVGLMGPPIQTGRPMSLSGGSQEESRGLPVLYSFSDMRAARQRESKIERGLVSAQLYDETLLSGKIPSSEEEDCILFISRVPGFSIPVKTDILIPVKAINKPYGPMELSQIL
eukprot:gene9683-20130_t